MKRTRIGKAHFISFFSCKKKNLLTGTSILLGGTLCMFSVYLLTGISNAQNYPSIKEFTYTGINDTNEVIYDLSLTCKGENCDNYYKIYAEDMGGSNLNFSSQRPIVVGGSENKINNMYSDYISHILGGQDNIITNSENITIIGGYNNNIIDTKNATVLGGSGNISNVTFTDDSNPIVLIGGESNKIHENEQGSIVIVGGKNNEIEGWNSYNVNILGGRNNRARGENIIIGGSNVTVDEYNNIFVFSDDMNSDSDTKFKPQTEKTFYLNVDKGVGIGTESRYGGLKSKGSVSFGEIDISNENFKCASTNPRDYNIGLQGTWNGCIVGCTKESATYGRWGLITDSEYCIKKCEENDELCSYENKGNIIHPKIFMGECVGSTHITSNPNRYELCGHPEHYINVRFQTEVIDSNQTCPDKPINECTFKCKEGYHLSNGGCYKDCTLDGITIRHGQTGQWVSTISPQCDTTCEMVSKTLTCNDGRLNEGSFKYTASRCVTSSNLCRNNGFDTTITEPIENAQCEVSCTDKISNGYSCSQGTKYYRCSCDEGYYIIDGQCKPKPCEEMDYDGYKLPRGEHGTQHIAEKVNITDEEYYVTRGTFQCNLGIWGKTHEERLKICNIPVSSCIDGWAKSNLTGTQGGTSHSRECINTTTREKVPCKSSCSNGSIRNGYECEQTNLCKNDHYNCNLSTLATEPEKRETESGYTWTCESSEITEYCHECKSGYSRDETSQSCKNKCTQKLCQGTPPENSYINNGNNGRFYLPERNPNTEKCEPENKAYTYGTNGQCTFQCNEGYEWNSYLKQCIIPELCKINEEEYGEIIIRNENGETITIMDRNLGAEAIKEENNNETSFGCYFQWGNNFGFVKDSIAKSDEKINVDEFGPENPYKDGRFIKGDEWTENKNENLRGGGNDDEGNERGKQIEAPEQRKGPCPEGWHVPSAGEWGLLLQYLSMKENSIHYRDNVYQIEENMENGANIEKEGESIYIIRNLGDQQLKTIQQLLLPLPGYLDQEAEVSNIGVIGRYWTSSPYAKTFTITKEDYEEGYISNNEEISITHGLQIRCFKDYSEAIYQNCNPVNNLGGYKITQTSNHGATIGVTKEIGITNGKKICKNSARCNNGNYSLVNNDNCDEITCNNGYVLSEDKKSCIIPPTCNLIDFINNKNYKEITIRSNSDAITLMDRDLGAEEEGAPGCYFQWGNNNGFPNNGKLTTIHSTQIRAQNYGPSQYSGKNFIIGHNAWDSSNNTNLRGGSNDNDRTQWGTNADYNNLKERKGPCPDGWHVPSAGEWGLVVKYRAKNKGINVSNFEGELGSINEHVKMIFEEDLKIKSNGYRDYDHSNIINNENGYYWTSTPLNDAAFSLKVTDNEISITQEKQWRADGLPIRCFKNRSCESEKNGLYQSNPMSHTEEQTITIIKNIENGTQKCTRTAMCSNAKVNRSNERCETPVCNNEYILSEGNCIRQSHCHAYAAQQAQCTSPKGTWDNDRCECNCKTGYTLDNNGFCLKNAKCGSAINSNGSFSPPSNNLCSGGTLSGGVYMGNREYSWKCKNGNSSVTCNAKRLREAELIGDDENMNDFIYGIIKVGNIIIMDRNLGATQVRNGTTDSSTYNSGYMGYIYQWGNNYGFSKTNNITETVNPHYVNNLCENYSPHQQGEEIRCTYDKFCLAGLSNRLGGGISSVLWKNGDQGPCPDGWHIITSEDINNIENILYNKNITEFHQFNTPTLDVYRNNLLLPKTVTRHHARNYTGSPYCKNDSIDIQSCGIDNSINYSQNYLSYNGGDYWYTMSNTHHKALNISNNGYAGMRKSDQTGGPIRCVANNY